MRLLLVRHAQSEWNAARRLQGQADIGLSELGMAQAEALRATIDAVAPCRSVASDLKRVRETAERINATFVRYTTGLREINAGDWTGRVIDDIHAEDGDAFQNWRAGTYAPPGSESWPAFVDRVAGVIEEERRVPCDNLLIVCHGGVIRALLQRYVGLDPTHIMPVALASLSALRIGDGEPPRLELFNYRPNYLDLRGPS